MRAAVTMVEVETEMVWVGDLAKAETPYKKHTKNQIKNRAKIKYKSVTHDFKMNIVKAVPCLTPFPADFFRILTPGASWRPKADRFLL